MSSRPCLYGTMRIVIGSILLLGIAARAGADPKPLTKEEQAKVDKAIEKGVAFLKRTQRPSGFFPRELPAEVPDSFSYAIGYTMLPALALLECGVPSHDPAIKRVTALLRKSASKLESTYELALALLYLDKLGERQDEAIIRSLALRLVAGQSYTGGWTYRCPRLKAEQETALMKALRGWHDSMEKQARSEAAKGDEAKDALDVPAYLAKLAVFQKPKVLFARNEREMIKSPSGTRSILLVGRTDNSNTQFAILGLWAANRHDIPLAPTFALVCKRFECSQGDDGTWDYNYQFGGVRTRRPYSIANTGVGLLALAIGRTSLQGAKDVQDRREKQIIRGLAALSRDIGGPADQPNYYFLWTTERVATLYNLQAFGEKEWYRPGALSLIAAQDGRGAWLDHPPMRGEIATLRGATGSWGTVTNTSLALLFLRRCNLMKDLTTKLPLKPDKLNKEILALTGHAQNKDTSSPLSSDRKEESSKDPP
jgi:hypothetical protein